MLQAAASQVLRAMRSSMGLTSARVSVIGGVRASHDSGETDEQFNQRYETFFNRKYIDGWEVRKDMNDILGMNLVPDPKIIVAALKAARRINDYDLAVRWMKGVKYKCGDKQAEIYPYLLNEVLPILTELGVLTPEEMGYDVPELALKTVNEV